ncbi:MAG: carbohydrate ABC transporter permease [Bacillota bacterium]
MKNKDVKKWPFFKKSLFYIAVLLLLIIELFPIFLVITTSFKPYKSVFTANPFASFQPTLANYKEVIIERDFLINMLNSVIVAVATSLISVSFGAMASYSLARFKFKGKKQIGMGILASRMIPPITLSVPLFILMLKVGILDSYLALILAHTSFILPYVVWLTLPFFKNVPTAYEEAALIDGCSRASSFIRIFIPLVAPGLVVAAIFSFVYSWNDFLYALILAGSEVKTVPIAVSGFIGQFGPKWGAMTASGTLALIPTFILALTLQKYIISGISVGGID